MFGKSLTTGGASSLWASGWTAIESLLVPKEKIFGTPLSKLQSTQQDELPIVVRICLEYFEQDEKRFDVEGLFRVSGSHSRVATLRDMIDRGETPDLRKEDPHVVTGLLKLYFRNLPEPLLTFDLYDCFIACASVPDISDATIQALRSALKLLPLINLRLISVLVAFLARVAQRNTKNKMTSSNLALVFAPSLLRSRSNAQSAEALLAETLEDSPHAVKLMTLFIDNYGTVLDGLEEERELAAKRAALLFSSWSPRKLRSDASPDTSLTLCLLHHFPIVLLRSADIGRYLCVQVENDLHGTGSTCKIEVTFSHSSTLCCTTKRESFQPVWAEGRKYLALRALENEMFIGSIDGKTVQLIDPERKGRVEEHGHLFVPEIYEDDDLALRSVKYEKLIGIDPPTGKLVLLDKDDVKHPRLFKLNLKVMMKTHESGFVVLTAPWKDGLMFSSLSNSVLLYQMVLIEVQHWGNVCSLAWYSKITGKRFWFWEEGEDGRVVVKTKGKSAEGNAAKFVMRMKQVEAKYGVVAVEFECGKDAEKKKLSVLGQRQGGGGGGGGEEVVEESLFELIPFNWEVSAEKKKNPKAVGAEASAVESG